VETTTQDQMQLLLIGVLFVVIFLAALQIVVSQTRSRSALPMTVAVLAILMVCLAVVVLIVVAIMGNTNVLYPILAVLSLIVFGRTAVFMLRKPWELNKGAVLILLLYLLVVLYATLFSRQGTDHASGNQAVLFSSVSWALEAHSIQPLGQVFANILLFVPLGLLFPMVHSKFRLWSYALLNGAMLSVLIETVQLVTGLGTCDIDDILANTLGALVGYWVFKLVYPFVKNKID